MPAKSSGYVTIRDVARLAGLSTATVTRTFQGDPGVRPDTKSRVFKAAEQLGYRPDLRARGLVTGRSRTLGLIVPSLAQVYWGEIAESVDERAGEAGFTVMVANSRGEAEEEYAKLEMFLSNRVDAIIVGAIAGDPAAWKIGGPNNPPVVILEWDATPDWEMFERARNFVATDQLWMMASQRLGGQWSAHITHDDVKGGAVITEYLLELGHERIAFAAGPPVRTSLLRLLGIQTALAGAGVTLIDAVTSEDSLEAGREAGADLVARSDRPTAIICYNDIVAIGVARAARDAGLNVPRDLSIVGHDDLEVASYLEPPLTTMRRPIKDLGSLAVEVALEARERDTPMDPMRLTGTLIQRGSTAPPPSPVLRRRSASGARSSSLSRTSSRSRPSA